MSSLKIILINVGWGDSILLETTDDNGQETYAMIDSNDSSNYKSSLIFLRRYFQRKFNTSTINKPLFDWVMLTHAHMDHGEGLKEIIRTFGTNRFYYSKSVLNSNLAHLQEYANRTGIAHQAIDNNRVFPNFGDVQIEVLWPNEDEISDNENNNSIVLALKLHQQTCMLTGDAEEEVWNVIKNQIPNDTVFFKVPHHGSRNGSLDQQGQGTAADMIKIAMANIHQALKKSHLKTKMILQVHDELVFDVPKGELEEVKLLVDDKMKNAIPGLKVPIVVDMGVGEDWLEAH